MVFSLVTNFVACNKSLTAKLYNKGIGVINFGKLFLNFIEDTFNMFLNIIPDKCHFCNKAYRHLNFMVT